MPEGDMNALLAVIARATDTGAAFVYADVEAEAPELPPAVYTRC